MIRRAALGLVLLAGPALASPVLAGPVLAGCDIGRAEFRWPAGHAAFAVEIADTEAEREKGLMDRTRLGADDGMLFVFDRPQPVDFWMKDTVIPLDMLFMAADGRVTRIKARAKPGDETLIPGGRDVQFVLEINGGEAARLGLRVGAIMRHPAISPDVAAWSCSAH